MWSINYPEAIFPFSASDIQNIFHILQYLIFCLGYAMYMKFSHHLMEGVIKS